MEGKIVRCKSPFRVRITITFDQVVLAKDEDDADEVAWERIFNEGLATIEIVRGGT